MSSRTLGSRHLVSSDAVHINTMSHCWLLCSLPCCEKQSQRCVSHSKIAQFGVEKRSCEDTGLLGKCSQVSVDPRVHKESACLACMRPWILSPAPPEKSKLHEKDENDGVSLKGKMSFSPPSGMDDCRWEIEALGHVPRGKCHPVCHQDRWVDGWEIKELGHEHILLEM